MYLVDKLLVLTRRSKMLRFSNDDVKMENIFRFTFRIVKEASFCSSDSKIFHFKIWMLCYCYYLLSTSINIDFRLNTKDDIFNCVAAVLGVVFCSVAALSKYGSKQLNILVVDVFDIYHYSDGRQNELRNQFRQDEKLKWHLVKVSWLLCSATISTTAIPFVLLFIFHTCDVDYDKRVFFKSTAYPVDYDNLLLVLTSLTFESAIVLVLSIPNTLSCCLYYFLNKTCCAEIDSLIGVVSFTDDIVNEQTDRMKPDIRKYRGNKRMYDIDYRRWLKARDDVYCELILSCYRHHRAIVGYAKKLMADRLFFVFGYVCAVFASLIVFIYTMSEEGISGNFISLLIFNSIIILQLFLFCHFGAYYLELNDRFKFAIYGTEWNTKSVRIRKIVLQLLTFFTDDVKVSASPNIFLSYPLFLTMMNEAYNYVNFLLSLKNP